MTEFIYWLGRFIHTVFEYTLEPLGNLPNIALTVLSFVLLFWWLNLQKKYNEEADANPDQLK